MKALPRLMLLWITLMSIAATVDGCGGGSTSGGIGGSGFQTRSIGSVSAVGSITVNGVRYETDTATIRDDTGGSFPEDRLVEGLVVEINAQISADGSSGTASAVTVITAVQGPIDQPPTANRITVAGQPVAIDDQTVIDASIAAAGGITALEPGDNVEVHGTVDPNGTIRATRIQDRAETVSLVKVRGFVDAVSSPRFTINGLTVDFSTADPNAFGPAGPSARDFVSLKGTDFNPDTLTLEADSVRDEDRSFAEAENAEIEGFITAANSPVFTLVSGAGTFQFRTDAATEFQGGDEGDLVPGLEVEVEGVFSSGILAADKVAVEDGIRLTTTVAISTLDPDNLTMRPTGLPALVLKLNAQTAIEDRRGIFPDEPTPSELLPSLTASDSLDVRRARASSTVIPGATELVVTELRLSAGPPADIELRGPLDAPPDADGDLTILGVRITSSGTTTFFGLDDTIPISRRAFLDQVTTGTLVDAEGNVTADNQMDATQLAIED